MSVLTGATGEAQLSMALNSIFTPLSSYSFLVFTVLYMPCIAAFAATKRELGSFKEAVITVSYQTLTAYVVATIIYQVGSFLL